MTIAEPPANPPPPNDATIDEDLSCAGCGYNLRGLAESAQCPECGAAIELSLQ